MPSSPRGGMLGDEAFSFTESRLLQQVHCFRLACLGPIPIQATLPCEDRKLFTLRLNKL